MNVKTPLNISSHADIPAGTGMGSSGCFAVTLINALSYYQGKRLSSRKIAELACHIEINKLKEPVGKQDQYAAAFGGLNSYEFLEDGSVIIKKIKISTEKIKKLKNNLIIIFTGFFCVSSCLEEFLNDTLNPRLEIGSNCLSNSRGATWSNRSSPVLP
jgi:D-glycero-alpha-D-manno-heptose-7-phosphate kinase